MTGTVNEESDVIKTLRQQNKSLQEKAKQVGCSQVFKSVVALFFVLCTFFFF